MDWDFLKEEAITEEENGVYRSFVIDKLRPNQCHYANVNHWITFGELVEKSDCHWLFVRPLTATKLNDIINGLLEDHLIEERTRPSDGRRVYALSPLLRGYSLRREPANE